MNYNYGYGVGYGTNPYYQGYQPAYRQENVEQPRVIYNEVIYGTYEQAKSRIVFPGKSALIINPDKNEAYVSSTDQDGKPHFKTFSYTSLDELSSNQQNSTTNSEFYVKREELNDFITKKDLEEINLRLEELKEQFEGLKK